MKRYPSLDVIRGVAIIGVLCFHVLNATFDKNAAISAALAAPLQNLPLIILAIILIYLGSFDKLFILLSALVNTITIDKQWQQGIERDASVKNQRKIFKSILFNQLSRGGLIVVFGYISENLLNGLVLNLIIQTPDAVHVAFSQLWVSNVIVMIGWGVIVSAVSYLTLLRYRQSLKRMRGILILLALGSLILTPVIIALLKLIPGFWSSPDNSWWTRDFGRRRTIAGGPGILAQKCSSSFLPTWPRVPSRFSHTSPWRSLGSCSPPHQASPRGKTRHQPRLLHWHRVLRGGSYPQPACKAGARA
jgi:hypothetical protein